MTDANSDRRYDTCGDNGGRKKNGDPCGRPAGWGTDHAGAGRCKLHFGNTESENRKAQEVVARRECVSLGIPIETTPAEALVREVWEASGNVAFYRQLVQGLPTHPEDDEFVSPEGEGDGHWIRGEPGIYGRTYHVSGIPTGEAKPHVLVQLYNDERKRKLDASAAALRAGVDERRVRIAEADAVRIETANIKAFEAMGIADRLEEFRGYFHRELAAGSEPAHLGAASAG